MCRMKNTEHCQCVKYLCTGVLHANVLLNCHCGSPPVLGDWHEHCVWLSVMKGVNVYAVNKCTSTTRDKYVSYWSF